MTVLTVWMRWVPTLTQNHACLSQSTADSTGPAYFPSAIIHTVGVSMGVSPSMTNKMGSRSLIISNTLALTAARSVEMLRVVSMDAGSVDILAHTCRVP